MRNGKVLVTGASGQLGYYVVQALAARNILYDAPSSLEMDITNRDSVENYLTQHLPTAVIHCAAYTSVDQAEDNPDTALLINGEGTNNIAQICHMIDAKLMYLSTDYVFSGTQQKAYNVDSRPHPINIYGQGKLAGELAVQKKMTRWFIVRTSWLYSERGHNFVRTILQLCKKQPTLQVVSDQIGSPTYAPSLAGLLCDMIQTERYGIYHATGEGICSWAEFARKIVSLAGYRTEILPVSSEEYASRAKRPHNSILSKETLDRAGFSHLPDWHESLQICINNMKKQGL